MTDFKTQLAEYQSYIEEYLRNYIDGCKGQPQDALFEAMEYSLLAGGKRLRPVLTMAFCQMCGGDPKKAAPFAAAVEMIHTYSLIHDDLPCMDNDNYRRGKLTNHKVYGEAMAVLAGDALLTDAFGLLASADVPAKQTLLAVSVLSSNAGSYGMVGGQVLDMQSESRECTEQEVLDIQSRKTGALLNSACALGVLAAGGTEKQLEAACSFAGLIGLAFQIRDDILDVVGDAHKLGKATGVDKGKNTFVRLYGISKCEEMVDRYTEKAIEFLSAFENAEFMVELAKYLTNRDY